MSIHTYPTHILSHAPLPRHGRTPPLVHAAPRSARDLCLQTSSDYRRRAARAPHQFPF